MSWEVMAAEQMDRGMVEEGWRKGPWTAEENRLLIECVNLHGEGRWNSVSRLAGLKRNGKSCRLRWVNYLRPDLKRGQITPQEERIISELHARWGNRWSTIARSLPGRTDNEIKNYWRTNFKKKAKDSPDYNSSERSKARLLRRQKFQQQQQLQQHQQQQAQMFDMKKLRSLLDENENYNHLIIKKDGAAMQNSTAVFPNHDSYSGDDHHHLHHQAFLYSMFNSPEGTNEEVFWDGLWNLDDYNAGNMSYSTNKNALYAISATPFSCYP